MQFWGGLCHCVFLLFDFSGSGALFLLPFFVSLRKTRLTPLNWITESVLFLFLLCFSRFSDGTCLYPILSCLSLLQAYLELFFSFSPAASIQRCKCMYEKKQKHFERKKKLLLLFPPSLSACFFHHIFFPQNFLFHSAFFSSLHVCLFHQPLSFLFLFCLFCCKTFVLCFCVFSNHQYVRFSLFFFFPPFFFVPLYSTMLLERLRNLVILSSGLMYGGVALTPFNRCIHTRQWYWEWSILHRFKKVTLAWAW